MWRRDDRTGLVFRAAAVAAAAALIVVVGAQLSALGDGVYLAGHLGQPPIGSLCWFYTLTALHCPMCGMLRSLIAVVHGDLLASATFHPAGPFMALMFVGAAVAAVMGRRGQPAARWLEIGSFVSIATGVLRWVI